MKKVDSIRDYIQAEPPKPRAALKKIYAIVKKAAPRAGEKLAWGMPTLTLEGNLVHFAAFKNHLSLFPGPNAIERFGPQLKKYVTSRGTIQFPYDQALPVGLITRIVKYRVKENLARAARKKKKKR
jgi:uncharacterized protein YdhG (YjbR/CyaY superfamily)